MEKRSLFYPLAQEGLTTLRIQYDWKTDHVFLQASKDWASPQRSRDERDVCEVWARRLFGAGD